MESSARRKDALRRSDRRRDECSDVLNVVGDHRQIVDDRRHRAEV
jgi:hypothetical protein